MQFLKSVLLVVLLGAIFVFAVQNTDPLTIHFLNRTLTAPLAITALVIYLVGMASGGTIVSMMRRLVVDSVARRSED